MRRNAHAWCEYNNQVQLCAMPVSKTVQRWVEREGVVKSKGMEMERTHNSRKTSLEEVGETRISCQGKYQDGGMMRADRCQVVRS